MKPNNLLSVGVVILALALPATASAQRGGGRGGGFGARGFSRPVVTAGQRVGGPTVVRPVVVNPRMSVRQPIVAGFATRHDKFGRIGFGSVPVRTGFGTVPVRTGFENAPFGTGVVRTHPVAPFVTGRHDRFVTVPHDRFRSRGSAAFRHGHGFGGGVVFGYPYYPYYGYPYYYTYPPSYVYPPYGYSTYPGYYPQAEGYGAPQAEGYGAVGVTAGPSTYFTDLANQQGASSGLTFDVFPASAEVYVDGAYVGLVQDFSAGRALMLVPGSHQIELRASGYQTVTLDVTTTPGQVIPYTGELPAY